jgi:4'-phosphopantetheinyl transferase
MQARGAGLDWLSEAERIRLASLAAPRRREQFIAGRWLVRLVLNGVHGGDPHQHWSLSSGADEAPHLLRGSPHWIGISHSGDWVACAVSPRPVGIDLERLNLRRDHAPLIDGVCNAAERIRILALPIDQRPFGLIVLWTLKEAWLKRRNLGVAPARMAILHTHLATPDDSETAQVSRHAEAALAIVTDRDLPIMWQHLPEDWTVDVARWGISEKPALISKEVP